MDNINKQFYNYLWAYILVALSGCLGNVVDGIIVGNLISEDGVSAINLSKPINQFIFTLHLLINAGAGMLVAYALGNKNIGEAKRLFTRAFMLSIGLGVLLAVFGGIIFPDETAQLLCSNKQILPLANEYMRILLLGNPAFPRHRIHSMVWMGYRRFFSCYNRGASGGHRHPTQPLGQP